MSTQLHTKKATIARLHCLTQDGVLGFGHADLAEMACKGGANWIQLRYKGGSELRWESIARDVQKVTKQYKALLIINDNVSLAHKIQADGVHLGKEDMDPLAARAILGPDFIIGGTANNEADILNLCQSGVDYIGLGPFRFTTTKKNLATVLSLSEIKRLVTLQNQVHVILIGGITVNDVPAISETGAFGCAVSSAINMSASPAEMTKTFVSEIHRYFIS